MGQLLNEMVSPHFYGLSIISNKVVGAWCGQPGGYCFQLSMVRHLELAWPGVDIMFVYNTFYIRCLT